MKKSFAIFSLLLACCLGFAAYLHFSLLAEKENVIFEDTILYGNADTVEGLTVSIDSAYQRHQFWKTVYKAGSHPQVSSDYTFYATEQSYNYKHENTVSMSIDVENYYFDENESRDSYDGINLAVYDLYQETGYNETKTMTVQLKDYYDYYPLELSIVLDNIDYYWNWNTVYEGVSPLESPEYADYLFLNNFFRIPIIEDDTRLLELSKSGGSLYYTSISYEDTKEPYYFQSYGAITKDAFLFTFSLNADNSGTTYDTSLIPGGYGIYRIPYETEQKTNYVKTTVNVQKLSMAYPLDKDIEILNMATTSDQSRIILIYTDGQDSNTKITLIDSSTMQEIQTIILDGVPQEDGSTEILIPYNLHIYDNFIAMDCSGDYLAVLNLTKNNLYELAFVVDIHENPVFTYNIWSSYETAMTWNGEQIVLVGNTEKNIDVYSHTEYGSFYLAVFDKNGLVYFSEHKSSLDRASYPFGFLSGNNYYESDLALKVNWE